MGALDVVGKLDAGVMARINAALAG
jgi:hypothetical protein